MKTVGIFEAKTRLSEICEEVAKTGDTVVVTKRGKPIVRIEPLKRDRYSVWEDRAKYIVDRGEPTEEFPMPPRSPELPDSPLED